MRSIEYLSPSAIAKFEEGVEGYYLQYLANDRPPRDEQNQAMSIGSSFDAYCKSYFHEKLFGKQHSDSNRFQFDTIFEAQVEEQHRDWARIHGKHAFEQYRSSGALLNLLTELQASKTDPRFEFDVRGAINGYRDGLQTKLGEVVLLGKPDAAFTNRDGNHIILDWKVNGWCSNYPVSPMPGYINLRDSSGKNYGSHKNCSPYELGSMTINIGTFLEHHKEDWARQLAIYSWLVGEPIGSDFICAIDQLVCKPQAGGIPAVRVAEHRLRVHANYQYKVFDRACEIWEIVHSNHIFRDMTLEDSQDRCALLDLRAEAMYGPNADPDFLDFTKR
jgi:hypothetical protein